MDNCRTIALSTPIAFAYFLAVVKACRKSSGKDLESIAGAKLRASVNTLKLKEMRARDGGIFWTSTRCVQ